MGCCLYELLVSIFVERNFLLLAYLLKISVIIDDILRRKQHLLIHRRMFFRDLTAHKIENSPPVNLSFFYSIHGCVYTCSFQASSRYVVVGILRSFVKEQTYLFTNVYLH